MSILQTHRPTAAAQAPTLPGLLQVHATVPDKLSSPCALVQPAPGDFLMFRPTLDDVVNYILLVSIYVSAPIGSAADAQELLDPYLAPSGDHSVVAAIHGDSTLGGIVASASCNYARNYRSETWDEARYIAVDFPVQVMT